MSYIFAPLLHAPVIITWCMTSVSSMSTYSGIVRSLRLHSSRRPMIFPCSWHVDTSIGFMPTFTVPYVHCFLPLRYLIRAHFSVPLACVRLALQLSPSWIGKILTGDLLMSDQWSQKHELASLPIKEPLMKIEAWRCRRSAIRRDTQALHFADTLRLQM